MHFSFFRDSWARDGKSKLKQDGDFGEIWFTAKRELSAKKEKFL